jgi:hypothetical protein
VRRIDLDQTDELIMVSDKGLSTDDENPEVLENSTLTKFLAKQNIGKQETTDAA